MPTYEYRCPEGHEFELFQKMSDPPRAECPECGSEAERQLSGGAGLLFKGKGFYITDYRSEEYRKRAESEKKSASGGSDGEGKKSGSEGSSAGSGGAPDGSSAASGSPGSGEGDT